MRYALAKVLVEISLAIENRKMKQDPQDTFAAAMLITFIAILAALLASATYDRYGASIPSPDRIRMPPASTIITILGVLLFLGAAVWFLALISGKSEGPGLALLLGTICVFSGGMGLATGKIPQRFHGGPPLVGPAVIVGSLALLALGSYSIYLGTSRRRDDDESKN